MSDLHSHHVNLRLVTKYRVTAEFPDVPGTPSLMFDERPPVGDGRGPNAAMVLGAAIGDCLSATLMNCLIRAHLDVEALTATVVTRVGRNDAGRFRISGIEVELCPTVPPGERAGLERSRPSSKTTARLRRAFARESGSQCRSRSRRLTRPSCWGMPHTTAKNPSRGSRRPSLGRKRIRPGPLPHGLHARRRELENTHEASRKPCEGPSRFREGGTGLNRLLSILRALIFDSRVEAGMPSLVAAPNGPDTRPMASSRTASINERSSSMSVFRLEEASVGAVEGTLDDDAESQRRSTDSSEPSEMITARSITFCNSRMLPGQS